MLAVLGSSSDSGGGAILTFSIISIAFVVLVIVATWKVFVKAGEAGWKSLIPIYNAIVLLRIVGRPWWWILLYLIPIVNLVVMIIVLYELSKSFGKGGGFTVGLFFLPFIFLCILGFGSATYVGPAGPEKRRSSPPPPSYAAPTTTTPGVMPPPPPPT